MYLSLGGYVTRIDVLIGNSLPLYREVLASTLRIVRPDLHVRDVPPEALLAQVHRLRPRVVICSVPMPPTVVEVTVWIILFPEERDEALVIVAGVQRALPHATVHQLLGVIDEVFPNGEPSSPQPPADRNHPNE